MTLHPPSIPAIGMASRTFLTILALLAVSLAAASCGGDGSSVGIEATATTVEPPSDPNIMLLVNGEPIFRAEIERSMHFHRTAYPDLNDTQRMSLALNNDLIPLAATRAHYKPTLDVQFDKMREVHASMDGGEKFRAVTTAFIFEEADLHHKSDGWHVPSDFRLSSQGLAMMETEKGKITDPFMTLAGIHILKVVDRTTIGGPHEHKTKIQQVILRFEEPANLKSKFDEVMRGIHVNWVHPDYEVHVLPQFRIRMGAAVPTGTSAQQGSSTGK